MLRPSFSALLRALSVAALSFSFLSFGSLFIGEFFSTASRKIHTQPN